MKKKKLYILISIFLLISLIFGVTCIVVNRISKTVDRNEFSRYTQTQIINLFFISTVEGNEDILEKITAEDYYLKKNIELSEKLSDKNIIKIYVREGKDETNYFAQMYVICNDQITCFSSEIEMILYDNVWTVNEVRYHEEEIEIYTELESNNPNIDEIAKEIYGQYLDGFRVKNDENMKIKNYVIKEIEILEQSEENFRFLISYDVIPYSESSIFNGFGLEENGWIIDICRFIDVLIYDSKYYMISNATGM